MGSCMVSLCDMFIPSSSESASDCLVLVQAQNLLLNGMLSDEVIDRYLLVLSDTISAVGSSLLLNSGISPRGQINHIVCIRKV